MSESPSSGLPSALAGQPDLQTPVPYAFERLQADGGGAEVARLEAQNRLFERSDPLGQLPPTPEAGAILDVGSGTGFWSLRLAARVPSGRITCLDRSEQLLGLARDRLEAGGCAARADFLLQDLRDLRLPEGAFDLVFTSVTLAHVRELERVLARLLTALKPGGWIACFEPVQQAQRFCPIHPPCPNLDLLMDQLQEVVRERGSDLAVALKVAHHLERLGMAGTCLRDYGAALGGAEATACIREVLLPLARAFLKGHWPAETLARSLEAAAAEAATPHLWVDMRRAVVLARKPG